MRISLTKGLKLSAFLVAAPLFISCTSMSPVPSTDTSASMHEDDYKARMQAMHEQMMSAKTPEERAALMKGYMAMMDAMKGKSATSGMGMSPEMMAQCMEMMQNMQNQHGSDTTPPGK